MCGIAGIVLLGQEIRAVPEYRRRMDDALKMLRLRGPDSHGIVEGRNWLFGHTRLSIIDPASGMQPLTDQTSGAVLTYNGEIYNHLEIRSELEARGYSFSGGCDTETVLKAYLEWGAECVSRFNGFFAFAVYDPRENIIFAARDRIGIKPFYYYFDNGTFCFASTMPAVLKLSGAGALPCPEAVSHYLSTGKLFLGGKTMIGNILSLRPGRTLRLELESGKPEVRQYWKRPVISAKDREDGAPSFSDAVLKTEELIRDSVKKRLMSDVPVGAFLSGGLDSSIIARCLPEAAAGALPFFCAVSDDDSVNELRYAALAADAAGGRLHEIRVLAEDFSSNWDFLVSQKGMPLSTPNEVAIYYLAQALGRQCRVTLTGEGADEIFGGYVQPHFSAYDFDRCARDAESADTSSQFGMSMFMLYGRSFFINDTDHYLASCSWMPFSAKEELFREDVWDSLGQDESIFGFYEEFFDSLSVCSSFDKRMHLHAEFNLENLLNRIDNSTMSASVEARVPFNDHRIVEFAFGMPDSYKMFWRDRQAAEAGKNLTAQEIDRCGLLETKRLPRRAFEKVLPSEITGRKKMSFPVPFEKWFSGVLMPEIRTLCMDSEFSRTYFRLPVLEKMIERKDRNLWLAANLCKWYGSLSGY